jgi:cysteine desulfurase
MIDMEAVGQLCKQYQAYFHSDTVQTVGHFPFELSKLSVDFITGAGHKFHGPKGVGILYINENVKISPLVHGGSQERNMRAGTENLYGIVGLAKAMEIAYDDLDGHVRHITGLKQHMKQRLQTEIPGVNFNGDSGTESLYTVLSVNFPEDGKSEMLLYNMDIEGVACSGGSACSSGSNKGSHVMAALYPDQTGANIRFSFSRFTTKEEVDRTVDILKRVLGVTAPKVAAAKA